MDEFHKNLHWKYHVECMVCIYCNQPVTKDMAEKEIKDGELIGTICHKPCEHKYMAEELRKKPVIVTQDKLDYYNRISLMFEANLDLSVETNQTEASLLARAYAVDMNLDQLFMTVRRMEAITAALSIMSSKTKGQAIFNLNEKSKLRMIEVEEYRKKQVEDKNAPPKIKKVYEKLSAEERADRNMITSYKKIFPGITDDEIQDMIDKAKKSKG